MVSIVRLITLIVAPLSILACEGECIRNITTEYLDLYAPIIFDVFQDLADHLVDAKIVRPTNHRQDAISYFAPIFRAYHKTSYNELENAIFPSYFHGKCLYPNGTVPHGCPNPDCPVVCGTPGSMVHFFPVLTRIVFNGVTGQLTNLSSPRSKTYKQVEKAILDDMHRKQENALRRVTRFAMLQARKKIAAERKFRDIMKGIPAMMLNACGGSNLSQCCWEAYMKKFILQFP